MKTDISLNDCIDKYCAEHARDNNPNVAAVWNALKSAVDTNDQHKASLNYKIRQELMRDMSNSRLLFSFYSEYRNENWALTEMIMNTLIERGYTFSH